MNPSARSDLVKKTAKNHGFDFCGIAKAEFLKEDAPRLEQWLQKGYHGSMQYMENHFEKRLDPTKLVPGSKSVVSLLYNYSPGQGLKGKGLKIARYAYGTDYHFVIKNKLKDLVEALKDQLGDFHGRVFVDSAPVMERQWAAKSGMGWMGKHTLLINRDMGSYFFLAELIIDLELSYDGPIQDYCGTCTRCIDACPTDAITDYSVDASKCISYLTIELKDSIPEKFSDQMENWIFGCDICQEVCPWNRFAVPHNEAAFDPSKELVEMDDRDWIELTGEVFNKRFKKSAMNRKGYEGLKNTIQFISQKKTPR